jgi:hypothetical protein
MSLKEKVAALLDAIADDRENNPVPENAANSTHEDPVAKFASVYREATGEELDSSLRDRLEADDVLREAITKVAARGPQRPTPLGEATDHDGSYEESRPKSKEAAEREAYDRFARGIMSIGQR